MYELMYVHKYVLVVKLISYIQMARAVVTLPQMSGRAPRQKEMRTALTALAERILMAPATVGAHGSYTRHCDAVSKSRRAHKPGPG